MLTKEQRRRIKELMSKGYSVLKIYTKLAKVAEEIGATPPDFNEVYKAIKPRSAKKVEGYLRNYLKEIYGEKQNDFC